MIYNINIFFKSIKKKVISFALNSHRMQYILKILYRIGILPNLQKQSAPKKLPKTEKKFDTSAYTLHGSVVENIYRAGGTSTARLTRIRDIIANYTYFSNELLTEAQDSIAIIKALAREKHEPASESNEKYVLVIGQKNEAINMEMVLAAILDNPTLTVLYRPISGGATDKKFQKYALQTDKIQILSADAFVNPANLAVVYTFDSPLAFEYMLFSVPVIVFGEPFYANFGLTDDRNNCDHLTLSHPVDITQLFAVAFILSTHYRCPLTDVRISLQEHLTILIFFSNPFWEIHTQDLAHAKAEDLAKVYSGRILEEETRHAEAIQLITEQAKYSYISPSGIIAYSWLIQKDITVESITRVTNSLDMLMTLNIFLLFISFLIKAHKLDSALNLVEYYGAWYERNFYRIKIYTPHLIFFEYYEYFQSQLYGRSISHIPHLVLQKKNIPMYKKIISIYIDILSKGFEYDRLEIMIQNLESDDIDFLYSLCTKINILVQADNDSRCRLNIVKALADKALSLDDNAHPGELNSIINRIRYDIIMHNDDKVIDASTALSEDEWLEAISKGRTNILTRLISFYINKMMIDHACMLNKLLKDSSLHLFYSNQISILSTQGQVAEINSIINEYGYLFGNSTKIRMERYKALRVSGQFQEAYDVAREQLLHISKQSYASKCRFTTYHVDLCEVLAQGAKFYLQVEQPIQPKGVVAFASSSDAQGIASFSLALPLLLELKKQGYATISLTEGMLPNQDITDERIANCHNAIPLVAFDGKIELDWLIDLPNKRIEAMGINFYQGFFERMTVENRAYRIDFDAPNITYLFQQLLMKADCILRGCLKLKEQLSDQGIPVYFILSIHSDAPYSIVRDFCFHYSNDNLQLIYVDIGYDYYYSKANSLSHTVAVLNATRHPLCRTPHLGVKEKFVSWYEENKDTLEVKTNVDNELWEHSSKTSQTEEMNLELYNFLREEKKKGKKILCCYSRLLVDLCYPYDGGPGHEDILDWIYDTIATVKNRDDVLLLLKPHPVEALPKVSRRLRETLADCLPENLPPNVFMLGHDITTHQLSSLLDLCLLWSGIAGYELTMLGVPVMTCGYWGINDYLIDILKPANRDDYHSFLKLNQYPSPSEDLKRRAAAAMFYRRSGHVSFPLRYGRISSTNDWVGFHPFNEKEFQRYLDYGDPMLQKLADNFFY